MLGRGQEKWGFSHLPPTHIAYTTEATCMERNTEKTRGYHSFPGAHAQRGGVALGNVSFCPCLPPQCSGGKVLPKGKEAIRELMLSRTEHGENQRLKTLLKTMKNLVASN